MDIKRGYDIGLNAVVFNQVSAKNAGFVTITAGGVIVCSLASINVAAQDRLLTFLWLEALKGVTAGDTTAEVLQSGGTAVIEFNHDANAVFDRKYINANATADMLVAVMIKVVTAGTLTLALWATSAGSNSQASAGTGQLYTLAMRGIG